MIRQPLAERAFDLELGFDILGQGLMCSQALGNLPIQLCQITMFSFEQFLDIFGPVLTKLFFADQGLVSELWMIPANAIGQTGS